MKLTLRHTLVFGGLIILIAYIALAFPAFNDYNQQHENYWELADRSSSIEDKYVYIDQMVKSFENSDLHGMYDASFYKNPSNNFDNNLQALKTLRDRLDEIKDMDVTSFEYQTAISQITAQEQGEARAMLTVLQGCWFKNNHILYWGWVATVFSILLAAMIIVGLIMMIDHNI